MPEKGQHKNSVDKLVPETDRIKTWANRTPETDKIKTM